MKLRVILSGKVC